jgi:YebC/PmpR family DNA-binding regulatory protein
MYEGYAQGGVALLIECLTDNKNRAAAEVRTAMTRNGGNMADPGSVAYNFNRKGVISITKTDEVTEDDILLAVLDAGAEEVKTAGPASRSSPSRPSSSRPVRRCRRRASTTTRRSGVRPEPPVELDAETARKVFKLIDALDDLDDVQNIFANYSVSPETQAELDED